MLQLSKYNNNLENNCSPTKNIFSIIERLVYLNSNIYKFSNTISSPPYLKALVNNTSKGTNQINYLRATIAQLFSVNEPESDVSWLAPV